VRSLVRARLTRRWPLSRVSKSGYASGARGDRMATQSSGRREFYFFRDESGRDHVVDSLELVPEALRPRAEKLTSEASFEPPPKQPGPHGPPPPSRPFSPQAPVVSSPGLFVQGPAATSEILPVMHLPSVGLGVVVGVVLTVIWTALKPFRGLRTMMLFTLAACVLAAAYSGLNTRGSSEMPSVGTVLQRAPEEAAKAQQKLVDEEKQLKHAVEGTP
ncbi:MAG: hypothetical protein AB2A00_26240, partial [Myxococcota bacterium]